MREKKYQYVIECYGWGGEVGIHRVTEEFLEYAEGMNPYDVEEWDYEGAVPEDVPVIKPNDDNNEIFYWHEGDLYHDTSPSSVDIEVFEVPDGEDARDNDGSIDCGGWKSLDRCSDNDLVTLGSMEMLFFDKSYIEDQGKEAQPCVAFYSEQKGFFGRYIIDTDIPYERKHLLLLKVETVMGEFIEDFKYMGNADDDTSEVELYEYPEALQKDFSIEVGYQCEDWWDTGLHSSFKELYEDVVEE